MLVVNRFIVPADDPDFADRAGVALEALAAYYQDYEIVPQQKRTRSYEAAMASLWARYPNDAEAAIFYALALYLFVTSQVDAAYVYASWVFAAFRALHSAVHCTFNLVMLRFYLYLFSTLAVWFIAIRAALAYFGA